MQNLVALPDVEVEIMSSKQRSTGAAVFEQQGLKRPGSGGCAIKPWTYMCKQYKPPGLNGVNESRGTNATTKTLVTNGSSQLASE